MRERTRSIAKLERGNGLSDPRTSRGKNVQAHQDQSDPGQGSSHKPIPHLKNQPSPKCHAKEQLAQQR
jgi:hypothetical protein